MGSESIAHDSERNNWFSNIQLVGQKYKKKKQNKTRFSRHCFGFSKRFSQLVGFIKQLR